MPRKPAKTLTDAEQRVMHVLWRLKEGTVRDVVDELCREKQTAYTTVLTVLGILHRKKYVKFRRDGRAHVYRPSISQTGARREAFNHLISQFFGGSKNAFAQYLIEEEGVDANELRRLKTLVNKAKDRNI